MAQDWIKVRTALAEDQDVGQLSDILGTEDAKTIGLLVIFWSWADKQTTDGTGIKASEERIDGKVGHAGFVKALMTVGWLNGKSGDYEIPNFQRHNGNSAKARALEAEAKRLRRDAEKVSDKTPPQKSDKCPTKKTRNVRPEKRERRVYTPIVPTGTQDDEEIVRLIWEGHPQSGRTRSSRAKVAKSWSKVPKEDRPALAHVQASLAAWRASRDWLKDGGEFVPGVHRWIDDRKWTVTPGNSAPAGGDGRPFESCRNIGRI